MKKTLGLDLGSNSLGWAILGDRTGKILDAGVLVFPDGINPAKDTLETPAAIRRAARMARRMKYHRKIRKWKLLELLIKNGMCPMTEEELKGWKKEGRYPTGNAAFLRWLKSTDSENPYCDRAAAADGPVKPEVLGRALYHLAQRRGFKSLRKEERVEEEEIDGEEENPEGQESNETPSATKEEGKVKAGIQELDAEILASGCKTLGQYFKKILDEDREKPDRRHVRRRYADRIKHYEKEFEVIMDAQGEAVSADLRKDIHKAIFDQRPLRSQAHLVGPCSLEPKSRRAQIAHPAFEEFRMLAFINNLTFEDANREWLDAVGRPRYPLTQQDRQLVRQAFMKATPTFKFGDIAKKFKDDPRFKDEGFRFHYYRENETLPSCSVLHRLGKVFGTGDDADPFSFQRAFDALTSFNNTDMLRAWLVKHHPELDEKAVNAFLNIHPREGRAQHSLKAIRRILPYLREGYQLPDARFFAKLDAVIPDFAAHRERILKDLLDIEDACRRERANRSRENVRANAEAPVPLTDRWRDYLEKTWGVDEAGWECLYPRTDSGYVRQTGYRRGKDWIPLARPRLPKVELGMIRNPLVQRAMTTLRRFVNYLGDHGKIDSDTTIRIELARNVNNFVTRQAWLEWQKTRQKIREEAREAIREAGFSVTEDALDRYVLWTEQGGIGTQQDAQCLYTGKPIPLVKLLSGNSFDIEHTVPRSKSGDDSLANKTVCELKYNRQTKKGSLPIECPNWEEIKARLAPWRDKLAKLEKEIKKTVQNARGLSDANARAKARIKMLVLRFERDYWRDKLRRFEITREQLESGTGELSGFKKRQLVDTGVMARHAVSLLKCMYPHTSTVNGGATAFARKAWGLQGDEEKDRTEHLHHAIDAMVIAALTPARFNAICSALKDNGRDRREPCEICPPPFENFAENVTAAAGNILVKHVLRQTTLRQSSKKTVIPKAEPSKDHPNGRNIKTAIARGDTVRGALHKETFYGCIQVPGSDEKKFVVRESLVGKVSKVKALLQKKNSKKKNGIVDSGINAIVKAAVEAAEAAGKTDFKPGEITMPSGVPILKVRVYAPDNAGPRVLRMHAVPSRQDYKAPYYVSTAEGSNFRLGLFRRNGKFTVVVDNVLHWAREHKKANYVPLHEQEGFLGYIMRGTMALTHSPDHPEELAQLSSHELRKRLYKVNNFEGNGLLILRYHAEARSSTVLGAHIATLPGRNKKGESHISLDPPFELLRISPSTYENQVLFEGIHFRMMLDGSIQFLDRA